MIIEDPRNFHEVFSGSAKPHRFQSGEEKVWHILPEVKEGEYPRSDLNIPVREGYLDGNGVPMTPLLKYDAKGPTHVEKSPQFWGVEDEGMEEIAGGSDELYGFLVVKASLDDLPENPDEYFCEDLEDRCALAVSKSEGGDILHGKRFDLIVRSE